MMRYRIVTQENLYRYYAGIGKKFSESNRWNEISESGLWKLPIGKEYGGQGCGWDECLLAMEGLVSSCWDPGLIALLVSQFSSLYLMWQYGTCAKKKVFLPRLISGELSSIIIKSHLQKKSSLLRRSTHYLELSKRDLEQRAEIFIFADLFLDFKNYDGLTFFIYDRDQEIPNSMNYTAENIFIPLENSSLALCDLINLEKLLYGVLTASAILPMLEKTEKMATKNASLKTDITFQDNLNEIKKKINTSRNILYSSIRKIKQKRFSSCSNWNAH